MQPTPFYQGFGLKKQISFLKVIGQGKTLEEFEMQPKSSSFSFFMSPPGQALISDILKYQSHYAITLYYNGRLTSGCALNLKRQMPFPFHIRLSEYS